jgi:hypothetical protein
MFLSRGELKNRTDGAGGRDDTLFRAFHSIDVYDAPFNFNPSFTITGELLEPSQEYELWLTRMYVEKHGQTSPNYPNAWTSEDIDPSSILEVDNTNPWRFTPFFTDVEGDLPLTTLTATTTIGEVNPLSLFERSEVLRKNENDPIENYIVTGDDSQGRVLDPNALVQTEVDSVSTTPFEVVYDDETYMVLGLPRRVEYELSLRNVSTGQIERVITMEVDYVFATDLNSVSDDVPDKLPDGVINIPVDFSGDATQYWAPWFTPAEGGGTGIFEEDIKQNFATAPTGESHWTPIEIIHPTDPTKNLRLINNVKDLVFTIAVGPRPFTAANYDVGRLGSSGEGLQELNLAVGNVDRVAGDWLFEAASHNEPIEVIIHYYLQNDLTTPQLVPPVSLFLTDVDINMFQITGRLSFINLKDTPFPSERYTRKRFPSLGG